MRAMIMGCVCAGGAGMFAMTAGAAPDAEAIVRKPPTAVYAAVSSAFENADDSTMIPDENGNMISVQVITEREKDQSIAMTLLIGGEQAGSMEFTFEPAEVEGGGQATRMTGELDVNGSVLDEKLGGGPNEDIARIPEFAWDIGMKGMVTDMATKIEQGIPLDGPSESLANIRAGQQSPAQAASEHRWESEMRQRQATRPTASARPMVDPNQSARSYLNGGN